MDEITVKKAASRLSIEKIDEINDFNRRIYETRETIVKQFEEETKRQKSEKSVDSSIDLETTDYCSICYYNVIVNQGNPIPDHDKMTVEFDCGHRFCSECAVEQLRGNIERAELDKIKCFDYECGQDISLEKIE